MERIDKEEAKAGALRQLQNFGLTQYEAQTLVNLLRLGTGTAQDVTRINDVPRTRVYESADRLHELGLIDIQHTTPRKFTVVSKETMLRTFNLQRENAISELSRYLEHIGTAEPQREQYGVWTVTGRNAVASRIDEFIGDAEEQIIYMTVDDLLTDDHVDNLRDAHERGTDIYLAGISAGAQEQIQDAVPTANMFETLWEWGETPAGSVLITDQESALVSAQVQPNGETGEIEETAIWGSGDQNSLVVVLRAIFTWRLDSLDSS